MRSKTYALVKKYYDKGLWKIGAVYNAVGKGWITADEYEMIVGEPYTTDEKEVTGTSHE